MRVRILGSAAGGGSPQWNCRCDVCRLAWARDPRVPWRTQCSAAVSADGERWVLLNASPDLRQQILDNPPLWPRGDGPRGDGARGDGRASPIGHVVVTNADIDHLAGLLTLRERQPLTIAAERPVLDQIAANPAFGVLDPEIVGFERLRVGEPHRLAEIEITPLPVPAKIPLWMEQGAESLAADGTALLLKAGGRRVAYVPACAAVTEALRARVADCDLLLFDGTLWRDDELRAAGVGTKTGRRMGHLPVSGPDGALAAWRDVPLGRRVFIHLNNTNPLLVAGSPERIAVADAGWEVAEDGMEFAW